ncbi:YceI family protein [Sphingomonas bacterium]|uniref:YceI family protein n=1 Tax=Sphingomonas bacterium TaxID=1895847 RepID=UPI001575096F|nr:YceI family protein [Sphingomonas bacterium]
MRKILLTLSLVAAAAVPALAQTIPGSVNVSAVVPGTYTADGRHTQVAWTVNHLGFSLYHGLFGNASGSLTIDPAQPNAAKVTVSFPIADVVTTVDALNKHIAAPDMFDAAKYPTGSFTSIKVTVNGTHATIDGNLTLKGVTKPVSLAATFTGVGTNPLNKAATGGFQAKGSIKRSDFGISYLLPALGDQVDLDITAAFEKKPAA